MRASKRKAGRAPIATGHVLTFCVRCPAIQPHNRPSCAIRRAQHKQVRDLLLESAYKFAMLKLQWENGARDRPATQRQPHASRRAHVLQGSHSATLALTITSCLAHDLV